MIRSTTVLASFILAILLISPTTSGAQECKLATQWVNEHQAEITPDYESVTSLPLSYRRAFYRQASPEVKSALWQNHLEKYLGPDLSNSQQAVLEDALSIVTPALFKALDANGKDSIEARSRIGNLEKRARAEFGTRAGEIFGILGSASINRVIVKTTIIQCSCSQISNWCNARYTCGSDTTECVTTSSGCGTLWAFSCDGSCEM